MKCANCPRTLRDEEEVTPNYKPKIQTALLVKNPKNGIEPAYFLLMSAKDFEGDPKFEGETLECMEVEFEIKNGKPVVYFPDGTVMKIK